MDVYKKQAANLLGHFVSGTGVSSQLVVDSIIKAVKEELSKDQISTTKEPELIQGLTAEQWQEIKKGGYLCDFGIFGCDHSSRFGILKKIDGSRYVDERGIAWINCRPAQIKGVMRPIFVEPVNKNGLFHFFDKNGGFIGHLIRWGNNPEHQHTHLKSAVGYIEI